MIYVGMLDSDIVEVDILVCENCRSWFGVDYDFVGSDVECTCPYCSHHSIIIDYTEIEKVCS